LAGEGAMASQFEAMSDEKPRFSGERGCQKLLDFEPD
jgi:hypothetical protein